MSRQDAPEDFTIDVITDWLLVTSPNVVVCDTCAVIILPGTQMHGWYASQQIYYRCVNCWQQ